MKYAETPMKICLLALFCVGVCHGATGFTPQNANAQFWDDEAGWTLGNTAGGTAVQGANTVAACKQKCDQSMLCFGANFEDLGGGTGNCKLINDELTRENSGGNWVSFRRASFKVNDGRQVVGQTPLKTLSNLQESECLKMCAVEVDCDTAVFSTSSCTLYRNAACVAGLPNAGDKNGLWAKDVAGFKTFVRDSWNRVDVTKFVSGTSVQQITNTANFITECSQKCVQLAGCVGIEVTRPNPNIPSGWVCKTTTNGATQAGSPGGKGSGGANGVHVRACINAATSTLQGPNGRGCDGSVSPGEYCTRTCTAGVPVPAEGVCCTSDLDFDATSINCATQSCKASDLTPVATVGSPKYMCSGTVAPGSMCSLWCAKGFYADPDEATCNDGKWEDVGKCVSGCKTQLSKFSWCSRSFCGGMQFRTKCGEQGDCQYGTKKSSQWCRPCNVGNPCPQPDYSCVSWGDPHIINKAWPRTVHYMYVGKYLLASADGFETWVQTHPCNKPGIACNSAVWFKLPTGGVISGIDIAGGKPTHNGVAIAHLPSIIEGTTFVITGTEKKYRSVYVTFKNQKTEVFVKILIGRRHINIYWEQLLMDPKIDTSRSGYCFPAGVPPSGTPVDINKLCANAAVKKKALACCSKLKGCKPDPQKKTGDPYNACIMDACAANGACTFGWSQAITTANWLCDAKCMKLGCEKKKIPCQDSVCMHPFTQMPAKCITHPMPNGVACNDKNAKTLIDWCQDGKCTGAAVTSYCYSTGDPHYYSTFWKKKWNYYGIGYFKLASALGSSVWTRTYRCARVSCNFAATIFGVTGAAITFDVKSFTPRTPIGPNQFQLVTPGDFDGGVLSRPAANQYIWTVKQGNAMFRAKFVRGFWKAHRVYYMNVYAYVVDPTKGKIPLGGSCWARPTARKPPPNTAPIDPKKPACPNGKQYTPGALACCKSVQACSELWQACMFDACQGKPANAQQWQGACMNPQLTAAATGQCGPDCAKVTCTPNSPCETTTCKQGKCIRNLIPNCDKCTNVVCKPATACETAVCDKTTGTCKSTPIAGCSTCSTHTTADKCNKVGPCQWVNGKCGNPCPTKKKDVDCKANPGCEWTAAKTCVPICTTETTEANCHKKLGCKWNSAKKCAPACKGQSKIECTARGNDDCQWSKVANGGMCAPKCSQFNTNKAKCNVNPECTWTAWNTCVPGCTLSQTATQCAANPFQCVWDTKTKECDKELCLNKNQLACGQAAANCKWMAGTTNACAPKCITNLNQNTCKAEPGCFWQGTGNKPCQPICTIRGTATACGTNPTCTWNNGAQQCQPVCTSTIQNDCNSDPKCSWDNTNNKCKTLCIGSNKAACDQDADCNWDMTTQKCTLACVGVTDQTKCTATGICQWTAAGKCENGCPNLRKSQDCNSQPNCEWKTKGWTKSLPRKPIGICAPICNWRRTQADCGKGLFCKWNGNQCAPLCPQFQTSATQCNAAPQCQFNTLDQKCEPACKVLQSNQCNKNSQCKWDAANTQCNPVCVIHSTSAADCQKAPGCTMNQKGVCVSTCVAQTTAQTCNAQPDCTWGTNQCLPVCTTHSKGDCVKDGNCNWAGTKCVAVCKDLKQAPCGQNFRCNFNTQTNTCEPRCRATKDKDACAAKVGCEWDPRDQLCDPTCSSANSEADCLRNFKDCTWLANAQMALRRTGQANLLCVPQCIALKTATACATDNECNWDAQQGCTPICQRLTPLIQAAAAGNTQINGNPALQNLVNQCQSTGVCDFNALTWSCSPICSPNDQPGCTKAQGHCAWNQQDQKCVPRCIDLQGTACTSNTMCTTDANQKCVPKCFINKSEQKCNQAANPACHWTASGTCDILNCPVFDQTDCQAASTCKWNAGTNKCDVACKNNDQATCKTDKNCVWDGTSKTCEPNTCANQNPDDCNNDVGCTWNVAAATCDVDPCPQHTNKDACQQSGQCRWDPSQSAKCVADICVNLSTTTCASKTECKVANGKCTTKCVDINVDTTCEQTQGCRWLNLRTGPFCDLDCPVISDAKTCGFATGCNWAQNTQQCTTDCSALSATTCGKSTHCMMGKQGPKPTCVKSCDQMDSLSDCNRAGSMCTWDRTFQRCTIDCGYRRSQQTCEAAGSQQCKWRVKNGRATCSTSCLRLGITACILDPFCRFPAAPNKCMDACKVFTDQSTCPVTGVDGGCTWDPNHSPKCHEGCKDLDWSTCQARFECDWLNTVTPAGTTKATCAEICERILKPADCAQQQPNCQWSNTQNGCVTADHYDWYPGYDPYVADQPDQPGGAMGNTLCCVVFSSLTTTGGPNTCTTSITVTAQSQNVRNLNRYKIEAINKDGTIDTFDLPNQELALDDDFVLTDQPVDEFDDFFGAGLGPMQVPAPKRPDFNNKNVVQWHIVRDGVIVDVMGGGAWSSQTQRVGCNGWQARRDNSGPDATFFPGNWDFADDVFDGVTTNKAASRPAPIGKFTNTACNGVLCPPEKQACQASKCNVGTCTTVNKMPGSICTSGNPLDDNEKCTGILSPEPECAGTGSSVWYCICQPTWKCPLYASAPLHSFVTPAGRSWNPTHDFGKHGWKKQTDANGNTVIMAMKGKWKCTPKK